MPNELSYCETVALFATPQMSIKPYRYYRRDLTSNLRFISFAPTMILTGRTPVDESALVWMPITDSWFLGSARSTFSERQGLPTRKGFCRRYYRNSGR